MQSTKSIKNKSLVIAILLLLLTAPVFGQTNNLNALQTQFNQYRQKVLQEKIFVHTDKSLYLAGEIFWFKLYNVDAALHQPLALSKVAYLEILDKDQKPILQTKVALENGSGHGSLYLPVSIASGNYLVRAYTSWMKNFSPEYYFQKQITIVNTLPETEIQAPADPVMAYDIQFFPEGGHLVKGLQSKIGFRAVDQNGHGIDFAGTLLDENNQVVTQLKPLKFGLGNFIFTPEVNKTYKTRIKLPNGKTIIKELPTTNEQGYVMRVLNTGNRQLQINVEVNNINGTEVYLIAHTRQETKVAQVATLLNNRAEFLFDENKLGDGVSHLTIFDKDKRPVCERLYFKRPAKKIIIEATTDQNQYNSRKKVNLNIITKNNRGTAEAADLSVSVYRTDSLGVDGTDIISYLYLSSDLSGPVESPGYYLKQTSPETDAALDNLMLTQGWRRFRWADIVQDQLPAFEYTPEYEGHIITADLKNKKTGLPASNITTYLSVLDKRLQLYSSISNEKGQVSFFTRNIYGTPDIVIQTNTPQDSLFQISISTPFSEKFSSHRLSGYYLAASIWQGLLPQSISMHAQNIYAADKLQRFYQPSIDSNAFYGKPYKKYLLYDYTSFASVEEMLREYVGEVAVRKQKNNYPIKVLNLSGNVFFEHPLVLLDGVPILDSLNKFIRYDARKIQKLEVVPEKYYLGNSIFDGIASFTTYKGNLDGFELNPQALVVNYDGLQLQREFYSPVYETASQVTSRFPDFRNLLYWSPTVKTDTSGKKQITFYTSDQTGKYIIVLQGLTPNGQAGSSSFSIEIKESL